MTDADLYDRILATITEQLAEQGLPDANPGPIADAIYIDVLGHGSTDEIDGDGSDEDQLHVGAPGGVPLREAAQRLLAAVDVARAVAGVHVEAGHPYTDDMPDLQVASDEVLAAETALRSRLADPAPHWPADGSGDEFDGGYDPTATPDTEAKP